VRRGLAGRTLVVSTALPAVVLGWVAGVAHREDLAARLRGWAAEVSRVALVLTAPVWLLVVLRGILYPVFGGDDLRNSWGGPTLVGAWAAHLAVGVAALLALSAILAWFEAPEQKHRVD
jgi:lysylphosphatidylglycerol synthetase-like protein (DUF2156 family)